MTVVTLLDFTPLPRADGLPWTQARIEEAPAAGGPWTAIETVPLIPVDTDPAHPQPRSFTTEDATLVHGWYRVVFLDATGDAQAPTAPLLNDEPGPRPTVAEVGALLRARTKIPGGAEIGTFDDRTRPTGGEVEVLIDEAVAEVVGKIGVPEVGSALEARARSAVKLYAAMLVELSYFPEQVRSDRSAFDAYERLYRLRLKSLVAEAETGSPGGEGDGDAPANASWFYPADAGGLVGWSTEW